MRTLVYNQKNKREVTCFQIEGRCLIQFGIRFFIHQLKTGETVGLDGVATENLEMGRNACSERLVGMFDVCLNDGPVPVDGG